MTPLKNQHKISLRGSYVKQSITLNGNSSCSCRLLLGCVSLSANPQTSTVNRWANVFTGANLSAEVSA